MKVLHVINWLEHGGAERLIYNFIMHSRQAYPELEFEVCTLLRKGVLGEELSKNGVTVHNLNVGKWDVVKATWKLYRLIRKKKYDIIHAHLFPASHYVSIVHRLLRCPIYVYTEHSSWTRRRNYRVMSFVDAFAYRTYDAIIANSEVTRQRILAWVPGLARKIYLIENGVPIPKVQKNSYRLSTPPRALVVSRLDWIKGVDIAIEALGFLKRSNWSLELDIVGDGAERQKLQKLAKDLPVQFKGFQFDTINLMTQYDILIVPSRREGFGLTAVEGLMVGIPLIASRIDNFTRIIREGETGLLFHPGDANDLALKIKQLLSDEDLRKRLAQEGRKEAIQRWTIDKFTANMVNLYSNLLGKE